MLLMLYGASFREVACACRECSGSIEPVTCRELTEVCCHISEEPH